MPSLGRTHQVKTGFLFCLFWGRVVLDCLPGWWLGNEESVCRYVPSMDERRGENRKGGEDVLWSS